MQKYTCKRSRNYRLKVDFKGTAEIKVFQNINRLKMEDLT